VSLHPFTEGLVAVHAHGNQAFGRKEPKLGAGSLLVIFATGGSAFKFGISLSRDSALRNPKLNGCRHSLPPHAQWKSEAHWRAVSQMARG